MHIIIPRSTSFKCYRYAYASIFYLYMKHHVEILHLKCLNFKMEKRCKMWWGRLEGRGKFFPMPKLKIVLNCFYAELFVRWGGMRIVRHFSGYFNYCHNWQNYVLLNPNKIRFNRVRFCFPSNFFHEQNKIIVYLLHFNHSIWSF